MSIHSHKASLFQHRAEHFARFNLLEVNNVGFGLEIGGFSDEEAWRRLKMIANMPNGVRLPRYVSPGFTEVQTALHQDNAN